MAYNDFFHQKMESHPYASPVEPGAGQLFSSSSQEDFVFDRFCSKFRLTFFVIAPVLRKDKPKVRPFPKLDPQLSLPSPFSSLPHFPIGGVHWMHLYVLLPMAVLVPPVSPSSWGLLGHNRYTSDLFALGDFCVRRP